MRVVVLVGLLMAACGIKRAEPPKAALGPPEIAWKDMSRDQRMTYMEKVIVPTMKPVFQEFDKLRFAEFGCKTCHGVGVDDTSFEMPNNALLSLPATVEEMVPLVKEKGPWVEFMTRRIKPTMARLLDLREYDPASPQPDAFGCHGCHRVE